jgi:hypothetical protein
VNKERETMLDLASDLNTYLAPGERVLWQGQGKRRSDWITRGNNLLIIILVAFASLLGVLAVTLASSNRNGLIVFIFFAILFIALGLGVGMPLALLSSRASKARYYVTNLAALIVYPSAGSVNKRVTVVPLKNLSQLSLSENRDGTGTLTLAPSPYAAHSRYSSSWSRDAVPTFADVEQPWDVYQLIRKQMANDQQPATNH